MSLFRLSAAVLACCLTVGVAPAAQDKGSRPNFVIVYADDLGYADLGCFGAKGWTTPHLDRLAKEGVRLTDFYVAQAVCSASRTALLTGCYPNRVGILGALGPASRIGISDREKTIAGVLKARGYATAIYGKWHLGHHPQFLPTRHGFDDYFGLPYSNDMWPKHPTAKFPDLPLVQREKTIELNPDQTKLTTWYTERAVRFIETNKDKPFFLYVPHAMPHVPLFVSDRHKGTSKQGLYGDVISEIDWSVGQIVAALKRHNLDKNTLVIFTSDNGPWLSYGEHAGSAGPLREGKGTSFEGGVRVPFVAWWPGKIPAGSVVRQPAMTIDLLPTLAGLAGAGRPENKIDGKDIWPLLSGTAKESPHEALFFYWGQALEAMRAGKWKLHFPHGYRTLAGRTGGKGGQPAKYDQAKIELALFDLENDVGEKSNVAAKHPDVVARLKKLADRMRADLGDTATKTKGQGVRAPGRLPAAKGPNVVFLFSDDQRFDTIAALGNKEIRTPNLDRLVKGGFAFTHTFIMGSQQGAVCVPSRAMMLTGRTLFHVKPAIAPATPTWPEVFRQAGYTTFGTGKWHNDRASFGRSFGRGGPVFFGGMSDQFKVPVYPFDPTGKYAGKPKVETKFSSELFTDAAVNFLHNYKGAAPFVLYVAYTSPHDPRTPPGDYATMYDPKKLALPSSFLPQHPFDNGEMKVRDEKLAPWPRTADVIRRHTADYYGMITHLDAQVGRILAALKETGREGNTLIVFAADNGLAVGRHGLMGKQNLYEHSVRVPLILSGPGIPVGKRSAALVYLSDLFPTLAALTGVEPPATVEGTSLLPIIQGKKVGVRDSVFAAYRDVQRMVRTDRWKLIWYPKAGKTQLFDVSRDPHETKDVASESAAPVKDLRQLLRKWQKQVGDPLVGKEG